MLVHFVGKENATLGEKDEAGNLLAILDKIATESPCHQRRGSAGNGS